jgi:hypothetical protein
MLCTNIRNIRSVLLIILLPFCIFSQTIQKDSVLVEEPDSLYANDIQEELKAQAKDSIVFYPKLKTTILYNKAEVETKNEVGSIIKLTAGKIEINEENNTAFAEGIKDSSGKVLDTPVFTDGTNTMEAEKLAYNIQTNKGKIWNAYTKENNLIVYGNEIKKSDNDILYLKNLKCIPCDAK